MSRIQQSALAIFLLALIIYNFPLAYDLAYKPFFNWLPNNDVLSTSLLPVVILKHGDFTLSEFQTFVEKNYSYPYFTTKVNGVLVSRYPVTAAVLAIPFYGVPLGTGWLIHSGHDWLEYPSTAFVVAKFASTVLSALAVLMFFFCAFELSTLKTSAVLAIVFAFGTSVWSTNSQGLWQQTPSVFLQLLGIWFLLRGYRKGAQAVAPGAFFFSAATAARPNNAIAAVLFTLFVWIEFRPALWRWILWSIPPAVFFFAYNAIYNGSPLVFGYQEGVLQFTHLPQVNALLGLFISPSRGLLIYSPFYLFAPLGLWLAHREQKRTFYFFSASVYVIGLLLISMLEYWEGGWGYGTRMLTDLLPYFTVMLIPVFQRLNRVSLTVFWAMAALAMVLQSFALWDYGTGWHWHWEDYKFDVWDWRENEPLFYFKEYLSMARDYLHIYLK